MRYLKDPKGGMGGEEQIHAYGSKQFAAKFPQAYAFIKSFKLDLADVETIEQEGYSTNNYEAAAKKFVDAHPEKLKAWLPQ
jgi:glycine betaine/proline transport system substrate-binding protein